MDSNGVIFFNYCGNAFQNNDNLRVFKRFR